MKEPLIIKSTFYNLSPKDLEETRRNIKRQMQEENPVVVLPCGFEVANVNTELLEQIKAEIKQKQNLYYHDSKTDTYYDVIETDTVLKILDNYIKELKGE